eukprot:3837139-Prymnesium_polylepis.1
MRELVLSESQVRKCRTACEATAQAANLVRRASPLAWLAARQDHADAPEQAPLPGERLAAAARFRAPCSAMRTTSRAACSTSAWPACRCPSSSRS